MIERRSGGTSLSLGVLWRKGGEESAFTQRLLPFTCMSESTHAHQWTRAWDEGGLSDAVSMRRDQETRGPGGVG